jgi:hypothetical protein
MTTGNQCINIIIIYYIVVAARKVFKVDEYRALYGNNGGK